MGLGLGFEFELKAKPFELVLFTCYDDVKMGLVKVKNWVDFMYGGKPTTVDP